MNGAHRKEMLARVSAVLRNAVPDAYAGYVFGSVARGDERADSDLDIAVLLPPRKHLTDKLGLIAELSRAAHREVDIVDLRSSCTNDLDIVESMIATNLDDLLSFAEMVRNEA